MSIYFFNRSEDADGEKHRFPEPELFMKTPIFNHMIAEGCLFQPPHTNVIKINVSFVDFVTLTEDFIMDHANSDDFYHTPGALALALTIVHTENDDRLVRNAIQQLSWKQLASVFVLSWQRQYKDLIAHLVRASFRFPLVTDDHIKAISCIDARVKLYNFRQHIRNTFGRVFSQRFPVGEMLAQTGMEYVCQRPEPDNSICTCMPSKLPGEEETRYVKSWVFDYIDITITHLRHTLCTEAPSYAMKTASEKALSCWECYNKNFTTDSRPVAVNENREPNMGFLYFVAAYKVALDSIIDEEWNAVVTEGSLFVAY